MKHNFENSDKTIEQMVDGIAGKDRPNAKAREKEIRKQLAGRAAEYFMFMDDDEEQDDGK